ncbi:MAG: hypothetical protein AB7S26_34550 [Sandaracinaceae bacterium]
MWKRAEGWSFGVPYPMCDEERERIARYGPTVDRWLTELEAVDDPYVLSAADAASCVVFDTTPFDEYQTWETFDVRYFLFSSLWEGGTVGWLSPVDVFFEHLVETLRRLTADGLIAAERGAELVAEMSSLREAFIGCFGEDASEDQAREIAHRELLASPLQRRFRELHRPGAPREADALPRPNRLERRIAKALARKKHEPRASPRRARRQGRHARRRAS